MGENRPESLPLFGTLDELVEHFDTHDWGDYLEQMPEAEFEMDIERRVHLIALDADLADKLTEIARTRHTSSEALANRWLRERVLEDATVLRESGADYHEEENEESA
jgi:predicted transcriptional regulator